MSVSSINFDINYRIKEKPTYEVHNHIILCIYIRMSSVFNGTPRVPQRNQLLVYSLRSCLSLLKI